jgi:hypothetical protein
MCAACAGRGGPLLDGELPAAVSEADVVGLLEAVLRLPKLAAAAREMALTAAMKLTARLPSQVSYCPCLRTVCVEHSSAWFLLVA